MNSLDFIQEKSLFLFVNLANEISLNILGFIRKKDFVFVHKFNKRDNLE